MLEGEGKGKGMRYIKAYRPEDIAMAEFSGLAREADTSV